MAAEVEENGQFKKLLQDLESMHTMEVAELKEQLKDLQSQMLDRAVGPRISPQLAAVHPQEHREHRTSKRIIDIDTHTLSEFDAAGKLDNETSQKVLEYERKLSALSHSHKSASHLSLGTASPEAIIEEEEESDERVLTNTHRIGSLFLGTNFEFFISVLLLINLILMAAQLQYHGMRTGYEIKFPRYRMSPQEHWPYAEDVFVWGDWIFAIIFTVEMLIRLSMIRLQFFRHFLNWIDFVVVCSSWVELFAAALPISPTFLRMLRLGKLLRAVRVVRLSQVLESLQLLLKCIYASLRILFWSLVLLMVIQCSAGMTISYMLSDYMVNDDGNEEARFQVFRYYGTFSKTLLTMFEVLFANWAPACRVLIDNVSEWYSVAFIVYRCFVGFAVLNVVNAVFVQSTMKVALADEEIIANEKARSQMAYQRRVNNIFRHADVSGDGFIDVAEFVRLLEHPQLQVWLHLLELDTTDLFALFKLLDDGDGEISLEEFEMGIKRIKGTAKSLDLHLLAHSVHKLSAKVDALLGSSAGGFVRSSYATKSLSSLMKQKNKKLL